jgi:hypothetical protein
LRKVLILFFWLAERLLGMGVSGSSDGGLIIGSEAGPTI